MSALWSVELYNLKEDIGERVDLANVNIKKRDELLDELLAWQKTIHAPIPTVPNPSYAPNVRPQKKQSGKNSQAVEE